MSKSCQRCLLSMHGPRFYDCIDHAPNGTPRHMICSLMRVPSQMSHSHRMYPRFSTYTDITTSCRCYSVFEYAFAADLGLMEATQSPVVWITGLTRDPSISYRTPNGSLESLKPYWAKEFASAVDAVSSRTCRRARPFQLIPETQGALIRR